MTTFSSLSAFLLTMTLVSGGIVASVEAAPAGKREYRQAKRAGALAVKQPLVVAQATATSTHKVDRQERRAKRLTRFDTNGNGQIDPAERLAMQKQAFARLDTNGDQQISLAELQAAKKQRGLKHGMRADKMGKSPMHKQGKSHMHHMGKGKQVEARFARLDTNKNGSIGWQEFSAAKQFKRFGHGKVKRNGF